MRRDFLKLCGLVGLGLAFPYRPARAEEKKDEPYPGQFRPLFQVGRTPAPSACR